MFSLWFNHLHKYLTYKTRRVFDQTEKFHPLKKTGGVSGKVIVSFTCGLSTRTNYRYSWKCLFFLACINFIHLLIICHSGDLCVQARRR